MTTATANETYSVPRINDIAPDFTAETTQGTIHFHDWIGDALGGAVFTSQRFHAGLHHRTRLHGQAAAGICQAQCEDSWPERRSGLQPSEVGEGH